MDLELPKTLPKVKLSSTLVKSRASWGEAGLLIIIIVLIVWFLILPKRTEVKAQTIKLEDIIKKSSETEGQVELLKNLIKTLNSKTSQVAKLDEALPLVGRTTRLQMLLEGIANSSGISGAEITVTGKGDVIAAGDKNNLENKFEATRKLQKISASITADSSFDKLAVFMRKLEHSGRLLDITSWEIGPGQDGQLEMKLVIDSYYYGTQDSSKSGSARPEGGQAGSAPVQPGAAMQGR